MTDDRLPDSPLDDAIERVVREMIDVDPAPGFERRVMQRLDRPSSQRFGWLHLAAAGSAVAALIVLAAVLTMPRSSPPDVTPNPPPIATTTPAPPLAAHPPTVTPVAPSTVRRVRTTAPRHARDGRVRLSAASVNEPPIHTIPELEPPDALGVDDIETRPVSVGDIAIATLEVRQLNLEPLRTLDERPKE